MNLNKLLKIIFLLTLIVWLLPGCQKFLEENPKTALNEATFWNNEKDAMMALMGIYNKGTGEFEGHATWGGFGNRLQFFSQWSDLSTCIRGGAPSHWPLEGLYSTEQEVDQFWTTCYDKISRTNYFLDNIDKVNVDANEKAEMVAEAKFIRAYAYFWLSQLFGNVPLTKTTLTFTEANSISRTSKKEVVDFTLEELTEAAKYLPIKRPSSERGRIEKGAALAIKGRLLMAEKRWSEAAETYKEIMDLNRYSIDPRFKELFEDEGDNNNESIWSIIYVQGDDGDNIQWMLAPSSYGGTNHQQIFQGFVDKFLMIDGKTIEESPLYDPEYPFENRDPRLYATVLLPNYSLIKGKLYQGHPDSLSKFGQMGPGVTGYNENKFYDQNYTGDIYQYGGDFMLIRYAEVLLSRLESELEAGTGITQDLLDQTINKIRKREVVDMPSVTITTTNELREIVRRERCVELGLEGLRYWDLVRWGIAKEVLSGTFYGMKITDNHSGKYILNDEGHLVVETRVFKDYYYNWPIPLSELDVDKNLDQNPGY